MSMGIDVLAFLCSKRFYGEKYMDRIGSVVFDEGSGYMDIRYESLMEMLSDFILRKEAENLPISTL